MDSLFTADHYVMLGLYIFTQMKMRFAIKQKEGGFYFSIKHHIMVVLYNFHSIFFVADFVNQIYLIWM